MIQDIKLGNLVCPNCGGKVIQTDFTISAQMTRFETPKRNGKWFCSECNTEFYAEVEGREVKTKSIKFEESPIHQIEPLGEMAQFARR